MSAYIIVENVAGFRGYLYPRKALFANNLVWAWIGSHWVDQVKHAKKAGERIDKLSAGIK
jgi:hypothetical protein